jgi:hypothetical protein
MRAALPEGWLLRGLPGWAEGVTVVLFGGFGKGSELFAGQRFRVPVLPLLKSGGDEESGVGRASIFG